MIDSELRVARAYLSRVGEPASVALWRYVAAVGPVRAMRDIRAERAWPVVVGETAARRAADPHADLGGHSVPTASDVGEALFFRTGAGAGRAA